MTDRLAEIRKRLYAATPGPWGKRRNISNTQNLIGAARAGSKKRLLLAELSWGGPMPPKAESEANAAFIAHAPEDIAYLLEEVKRWQDYIHRHHIGVDANIEAADEIKRLRACVNDLQRQQDDGGYP